LRYPSFFPLPFSYTISIIRHPGFSTGFRFYIDSVRIFEKEKIDYG